MMKKDWLLLTIGSYIEPIQVQKALFKFAQESSAPAAEKYDFRPYNWGPHAIGIYNDLEELQAEGFVEAFPTGRGWSAYRLTLSGEEKAQELKRDADHRLLQQLDEKRQWVVSRSFRKLLSDVYEQYPAFAERSLFAR